MAICTARVYRMNVLHSAYGYSVLIEDCCKYINDCVANNIIFLRHVMQCKSRSELFLNILGKSANINSCMKSLCEIMVEVSYIHFFVLWSGQHVTQWYSIDNTNVQKMIRSNRGM